MLPKQTNKNLRCGNRKGLLGRNDQTHHRMGPKTMESIPPSKRNTQADIQLRTQQTNHQQETDGCIQIKHNPEHQPSRMSSKSTAYVPPKTASTPTKANTQTCSYLDFNQFLIRRITKTCAKVCCQTSLTIIMYIDFGAGVLGHQGLEFARWCLWGWIGVGHLE